MREASVAALTWFTAASCGGGNCVQVAALADEIAVRDSKNPEGAILRFTQSEWKSFLDGARNGEFDHLA